MSDGSSPAPAVNVDSIWADLTEQHFALTNDQMIGLPNNFRETVLRTYFNDRTLRHDEGDLPADRKRARDVVEYQWRDGRLHLREHDTITITDRAGIPGKRDHSRVWLLDDPNGKELVRTFLGLVPSARRQNDGTLGVNLFRTHTNVVTKPHRDNEEFVVLYVLDRVGDGAESSLYNATDVAADGLLTAGPVFKHQLNPGEILMFDDECFIHDATPLQAPLGGKARRDVLICTVDYRSTYLDQTPPFRDERIATGSPPR